MAVLGAIGTIAGSAVSPELQQEIEQFLYHEAALLDEREFEIWFELLADDIHYWMPVRSNRQRRDGDRELSGPHELAYFDEDKESLGRRINRLQTGMAWAEDPPSRTRHTVSNVRIAPAAAGEYDVHCNFFLYRTRLERDVDIFVGGRTDLLRRVETEAGWEIVRRKIVLDQAVLLAKNLSVFF